LFIVSALSFFAAGNQQQPYDWSFQTEKELIHMRPIRYSIGTPATIR
jgi:hypothetical protein